MKNFTKSLLALLMVVSILASMCFSTSAAAKNTNSLNQGTRHVVCDELSSAANSYYSSTYDYEKLSNLSSSQLKETLKTLMTSTHTNIATYDDCHYKADQTDCENGNGKVVLLYTDYTATMDQWNGWNREHVWPQSLGGENTSGGGADLHHIRPSDGSINSSRGNLKYGYATGGSNRYGNKPATGVLGGKSNSTYFEPLDNVKGDVARICLYVYVRWGSSWGATDITKVFQSVDVLLEWCALDPVDEWEMGRNDVVEEMQGNRNVFIDYPEYAWLIFGKEVPSGMVTPSGYAMGESEPGDNPGTTPDTPVVPDTPVTPDTPDTPDTPVTPEQPGSSATYTKVTEIGDVVTGTYVLMAGNSTLGYFDNGWVYTGTSTVSGDKVTSANSAWTITVTANGKVKLTDKNGTTIAPKPGNNNGILGSDYTWELVRNSNGTFSFKGQGSDTTILALNKSEGKFRAYKTTTANGSPSSYPSEFSLYLVDTVVEEPGENPGETPVDPNPDQPGETPDQPGEPVDPNPDQPGETPDQPGEPVDPNPDQPGETPDTPITPDNPTENPDQHPEEGECTHSFGEWFDLGDIKVRNCSLCGIDEIVSNRPDTPDTPATPDYTPVIIGVSIAAVLVVGAVVVFIIIKKRKI